MEELVASEDTENTSHILIKVIGVGGAGSNAINRMIEVGVRNIDFVATNTDVQALRYSKALKTIILGEKLTGGLGAGGVPEIGEKAAEESIDTLRNELTGADMVFITAGMGGGTGTGASPVIARVAKELGILVVAVVTKPFAFELKKKMDIALEGINRLAKHVDTIILIPNENIEQIVDKRTTIKEAFLRADDILRMGVQGISDVVTENGEVNIDFADVRSIMENKGYALMGIGRASGDSRAIDAATAAIHNPILDKDVRIDGATGVLINISSNDTLTLEEFREVMEVITSTVAKDAVVIYGLSSNPFLEDSILVTVIATGFGKQAALNQSYDYAKDSQESLDFDDETQEEIPVDSFRKALYFESDSNNTRNNMDVPTYLRNKKKK